MENDAVIAAAKLIASIALTKKQNPMNIGPLGTLSSILEKKNPNNKLDLSQDGRSHPLKALEHHFLLIKRHSYKTHNAFYYHLSLNDICEIIQTLPNYFWLLSPFPLYLAVNRA